MKRYFILIILVIISSWLLLAYAPNKGEQVQQVQDVQAAGSYKGTLRPDINFGKIPLYFVANKGQVNEKALFYAKASRYTLWLTKEGLVFDSTRKVEGETTHPAPSGHPSQEGNYMNPHSPRPTKIERDVSRFFFLNANKNPEMVPVEETKLRVNYFKGKDKSQWHCDIPTSQAVLYKSLYKNIDLKVYGIEKEIEYDWIVKPGGNPGDIRFQYKNVKGTQLDEEGNLLIETDFGQLMHKKPVSYQRRTAQSTGVGAGLRACPDSRKEVEVKFKKIAENTYGFELGEYDKSRELIIDPVVLAYSTYLGGDDWDYGSGIAVDGSGCVYVTGSTDSLDFPTLNEYQTYQGYDDIFITKLDTTKKGASSLIYSTYLGGSADDLGFGITVDSSGCAYVTGYTESPEFPTLKEYQTYQGSRDAFITDLDTTKSGNSSLIYSTYLGGSDDDLGFATAVDSNGCAYVTGETSSSDFPILNEYQADLRSTFFANSFITKLVLCTETSSIQLNRGTLYFAAVSGGFQTGSQTFLVYISGGCGMQMPWNASCQETWIEVTPKSAAGSALVTVSVDTGGLAPGTYTGTIFITYGSASNSVTVNLTIYDTAFTSVPFGEFSTPPDASVARGSIPVTGWVLDDIQVESVKIYRDGNIYVGDAVFVDGARPDVEAAFPTYPFNYRAGWGYMLLTNFFPNGGNGTHTLYAAATDVEGNTVTLGAKTIVCDNANAVKPFGTIDTPVQGGTTSGPGYINWGWVLTPQPNIIPTDGSTIHVWVDGINIGNPVYNVFRSDIAALFPGYANSDGAAGYFHLDTTAYANGVHSIQWTVTDSGGNTDGIGSRYFIIQNSGSAKQSSIHYFSQNPKRNLSSFPRFPVGALERRIQEQPLTSFESIPADPEPVLVKTGFDRTAPLQSISPDDSDIMNITIPPAGRTEIHFQPVSTGNNGYAAGFQVVGNRLRPLPPGSTLDAEKGVFYWQPGPAFIGSYDFLFINPGSPGAAKKIRIIIPEVSKKGQSFMMRDSGLSSKR